MSNHPKRRIIAPKKFFPAKTPLTLAEQMAIRLDAQIRRDKHDCHYVELGNDAITLGYVECTCGFVIQSPFGEPQGAKQVEEHRARFHVIHDPMGAKYRD